MLLYRGQFKQSLKRGKIFMFTVSRWPSMLHELLRTMEEHPELARPYGEILT